MAPLYICKVGLEGVLDYVSLTCVVLCSAAVCCAGGEFAEAVHYVANVWLPAKQVGMASGSKL